MFNGNSTCEITSPVAMFNISIREEIILFSWVGFALFIDIFQVDAWSRVENFHIKLIFSFVNVINQFIKVLIDYCGISPFKVWTHCVHKNITSIVKWLVSEILYKLSSSIVYIIAFQVFIVYYWFCISAFVEIKSRRGFIMIVFNMGENRRIDLTLLERMHNHLHILLF